MAVERVSTVVTRGEGDSMGVGVTKGRFTGHDRRKGLPVRTGRSNMGCINGVGDGCNAPCPHYWTEMATNI